MNALPPVREALTRHPANPILTARDFPRRVRAVYNSAAVKTADGRYVMVCRVNEINHRTRLWRADSANGIRWTPRPEPYAMPDTETWRRAARSVYYDPRLTWLDGEWKVLVACEGDEGSRVALFTSKDLETLEFRWFLNAPDNRNMVLFPERGPDGRYLRLERPNLVSAGGKGNIWMSFSPDLRHWGDSVEVLRADERLWNYAFSGLGASTVPFRTPYGWLVIFHAIMNNCTTREYSAGAMLLDPEEPWRARHVTRYPILFPEAEYELRGLVEHVCFPCSMIVEPDESVKVYYGAADTVQCLATGRLGELIEACLRH